MAIRENRVPLAKPAAPARTSSMMYLTTLRTTTHQGSVTLTPAFSACSGSLTMLCIWSFVSFTFMASLSLKFRCKGKRIKQTPQTMCCCGARCGLRSSRYGVIYIKYIYHDTSLYARTPRVPVRISGTCGDASCMLSPMKDRR